MKTTLLILSLLCLLAGAPSVFAQAPAYVLGQTLQAPADTMSWGNLGYSSALSGNHLVLGAYVDSTTIDRGGAVKIFDATTGALTLTITSPVPQSGQEFGNTVAIEGDRLVIGARRTTGTSVAQGAVYVYDLGGATPAVPVLTINNPQPSANDFFGVRIALQGNRLVVSASNNDTGATNAGRLFVYDLGSATPGVHTLAIDNPAPGVGESFGVGLDLNGNTLVAGALDDDTGATNAGIVYVFDLAGATPGMPVHTIENPDPLADEEFGSNVSVSGTKVVIASYANLVGGVTAGSVYVYDLTGGTPTIPVHTIHNPSPAAGDFFGLPVTLEGDRLVVGASRDHTGATQTGSAYVYELDGGTPTVPVRTLNNPTPATQDFFGFNLALSGARVLVGAYQDDTAAPNAGAGYLYDLNSAQPATPVLTVAHAGAAADNHFGTAVAVSGAVVAVGLPDDDAVGVDAGSVTVYDMASATPATPVLKLDTVTPTLNSRVGASLALEGARLVVGAPKSFVGAVRGGQAYVFNLSSATPKVPVFTLPNPSPVSDENFGNAVALSGSIVVVGAPNDSTGASSAGSAYVFDLNSASPAVPILTLNNPTPQASDLFGSSVAISGTRVVVGAFADNTGADDAGSAYVYDLTSGTPDVPVHTLNNPGPALSDRFGYSVAMDGNRVVVGASGNTVGAIPGAGTVFEYDLGSATPTTHVRFIDHPSPAASDAFGYSIALAGSKLVVGVPSDNAVATDAGRAYVFDLAGATPATPIATLNNPVPAQSDAFGTAVGIQGSSIVVGLPNSDLGGRDQGAAVVFREPSTNASLAGLIPSLGTLSPGFDSATLAYSVALPGGTSSMTFSPTTAQSGATVTVNGNVVAFGGTSSSIPLTFGANTITIVVTAEDQTTTQTYIVTANVAGSGALALAGSVFTVNSGSQAAVADITVLRSGSMDGAISCSLSSTDGSATSPANYTAQNGTPVSMANGIGEAHVMIPIAANATTTTAKVFTITLGDISSGATLGSPSTATVVILPPASAADVKKPVVKVTLPANNATMVDTLPVTLSGTATDNIGVAKVQVSVNNGMTYADATLADIGGTSTTWTINVTPLNGPNAVKVRALDFKGNVSALSAHAFTHLRTLTVGVSGPANSGGVDAGFMPTSARQVGKSYTITAKAKAGHVFDGWTVNNMAGTGITTASAELPKLTFIMQPGLVLTAKFLVNPFTPAVTGDFSGLIQASAAQPPGGTVISHSTTGLCTAKLTTTGVMSGSVKVDGLSLPFTAQCDNTGVARFGPNRATTQILVRPGKLPAVLSLKADLTGATKTITGTLTELYRGDITAESDITAHRHAYDGKAASVPAAYVKSYTGRLKARTSQGAGFNGNEYPAGDGFITFKVQANGLVSMAGRLADDTGVTFSGNLSQTNHWPVYQSLYSNKGCVAADAVLDDTQADSDATAMNMLWFRPYQDVQWYPYGWSEGIYIDMLASKYTPPPAAVLPGLNPVNVATGNMNLTFTGGLLTSTVTKFVNLTPDNKATNAPLSDKSFSFKLVPATGLISGDFTHSDSTKPKWQGVLLQKGANKGGHGYFMSSKPAAMNYLGESGKVSWQAQ